MKIPEVRLKLLRIAERLRGQGDLELVEIACEIEALERELWRRKPSRVNGNRKVSKPVTSDIIHGVLLLRRQRRDWTQMEIAHYLGINPGRVSEILKGYRK